MLAWRRIAGVAEWQTRWTQVHLVGPPTRTTARLVEWQTRWTQNPLSLRSSRFKSGAGYWGETVDVAKAEAGGMKAPGSKPLRRPRKEKADPGLAQACPIPARALNKSFRDSRGERAYDRRPNAHCGGAGIEHSSRLSRIRPRRRGWSSRLAVPRSVPRDGRPRISVAGRFQAEMLHGGHANPERTSKNRHGRTASGTGDGRFQSVGYRISCRNEINATNGRTACASPQNRRPGTFSARHRHCRETRSRFSERNR